MKKLIKSFRSYWVQDISFISLLAILVFAIFILPIFIEMNISGMTMLNIMLMLIFFVGIWSANNSRLLFISVLLFSIHLILKIIRFSDSEWEFPVLERLVAGLNTLVFIVINLSLLFRDDKYNFERVLGAVNIYLLIALLGAFLFELIYLTLGSAIEGNVDIMGTDKDFVHYIYYSLVSLTTVGYGDIFPANHAARMLSVFLSAIGMLFPAVIIARLISASEGKL
jgi:hypothetical protein